MHATTPSSLDSAALTRRLGELAGNERHVLVDFLLHLEEFDRRRAYLEEGYDSLWAFCQRALLLRSGPTALRITAMRALRRFPVLAGPLRAGQLCLTTLRLLEPILTDENVAELIARASFMSKGDVERLVVSLQPRSAPRDGVRKLPDRPQASADESAAAPPLAAALPLLARPSQPDATCGAIPAPRADAAASVPARAAAARPTVEPVAEDAYSIRVTVDAAFKAELDQLKALLSHKIPSGELRAVLREAVRCAIEAHGKRRGAVEPKKKRAPAPSSADGPSRRERTAIPAELRRQVWKRDEGRCTWRGPDGRRCESTWRLEVDHVHPAALGGPATLDGLRLLSKGHNLLYAEQTYGRAHMAQFRRGQPRTGKVTDSRLSDRGDFALEPAPTA